MSFIPAQGVLDTSAAPQLPRVLMLDFWRFVAIVIVILSHFAFNPAWKPLFSNKQLEAAMFSGRIAVLFFFFISGYVVSKAALKEIRDRGAFSTRAFYIRRAFRIIPPLTLYLAACWLLGASGTIRFGAMEFASGFFYLCNTKLPHVSCNWFNGHTWSLAFEEQFYLLFPLLLARVELGRMPALRTLGLAALPALLPLGFPDAGASLLLRAYFLFLTGYFCAKHDRRIFDAIRGKAPAAIPLLVVAAFFPYILLVDEHTTWPRLIYTLAIPPLVMCTLALDARMTLRICKPWLLYIGRMSYSIYLWQELATSNAFFGGSPEIALLLTLLVVPFCAFLYEFMEKPLMRLGRTWS